MLAAFIALFLAAGVEQPPETRYTGVCVHNPSTNKLVGANVYSSYDGTRVWRILNGELKPLDPVRLVRAKGKPFYDNAEPVVLQGRTYVKYGLPRIVSWTDLEPTPYGLKEGLPFYQEPGKGTDVLYALHEPVGCEFQPYQVKP